MANWKDVLSKIQAIGSAQDVVRREAIKTLSDVTERNVIVYYSGWLQKPDLARRGTLGFEINDSDKNGFMATINGLDRTRGLDLVLHTPGGEIAATESRSLSPADVQDGYPCDHSSDRYVGWDDDRMLLQRDSDGEALEHWPD